MQQEQWAKALKIGEFALDDLPASEPRMRANVCCNQARCLIRLAQDEQALQIALQAKEEELGYGGAWYQLGSSRYNLQQVDDAVTCFEKALELGLTAASKHFVLENLSMAKEAAAAAAVKSPAPRA